MDGGYVKLWRCSLKSRCWNNEGLWKVWCWCLMKATYRERWESVITGRGVTEIHLLPGQFIFGRNAAAKELNMSSSSLYDRMKKLKISENLDINPGTHFSIITIRNWEKYQSDENENQQANQQASNRQATGKQHKQEGKEGKEGKNKNIKSDAFQRPVFIPDDLWTAFIDNRKFKKLQNSAAALKVICGKLREATERGYTIEQCVEAYITSKWQRFDPDWMDNTKHSKTPIRSKRDEASETRSRWARELLDTENSDISNEGMVRQIQGPSA